jgi:hypothetical protein
MSRIEMRGLVDVGDETLHHRCGDPRDVEAAHDHRPQFPQPRRDDVTLIDLGDVSPARQGLQQPVHVALGQA